VGQPGMTRLLDRMYPVLARTTWCRLRFADE
jgi:hypothetical protein